MKQSIFSPKAPIAIGPYSQAILSQGFLYISGQLPINQLTGEMELIDYKKATLQILKNITHILKAAELTQEHIIKTTIMLKDLKKFDLVNEAYNEFFTEPYPARSTFQVSQLPKNAIIEIEAIASQEK